MLKIEGYEWIGHNRKSVHKRAKTGSGGVGFLIKKQLYDVFTFSELDNSYEGILWLKCTAKQSDYVFLVCVCYLPPDGSTRHSNPDEFYDTLLSQVFMYQQIGPFYICGDFNSRIGNMVDFIEGVDVVPQRNVIDFTRNMYGEKFLEFLISANCCVLNGRQGICAKDDFTSVSTKGLSVVDFCIVPHENLDIYSEFKVHRAREMMQEHNCVPEVDPSKSIPDHSLLSWSIECECLVYDRTDMTRVGNIMTKSFTKWSRDVPGDFMNSEQALKEINEAIARLEIIQNDQDEIDEVYENLCMSIKTEMNEKLESKKVTITSGLSNKRRKICKPWWNEELTEMWNAVCLAEDRWRKATGVRKAHLKSDMRNAQKQFDRKVQSAKRVYWRKAQEELLILNSTDPKEFWKKIGQIGIANDRQKIPWEVYINNENVVSSDPKVVLEKWKSDFSELLNPESHNNEPSQNVTGDHNQTDNAGLDNRITMIEVNRVLCRMKTGKAVGIDEIPLECLKNEQIKMFMVKMFNLCFDHGVLPSLWRKSVINPIPKDSTKDPRVPTNYRGIALACSMYKVYCGVLNQRIVKWAEVNNLIADEQNGFRQGRSTIDQLASLTSIIENRKLSRKHTFVTFVDFSKAYDRINRPFLWQKLSAMGLSEKMVSALQVLYSEVECCVKINGFNSDWFSVNTGLKQGCLVSPVLFNLYINDLVDVINRTNKGVEIGDRTVSIMLYADDICLLSENEEDMQHMINELEKWCQKWDMKVNTDKTMIVHFRPQSCDRTDKVFRYGADEICIVPRYKYLGLVLDEHLNYHITAQMVAKSACRALGILIAKCKASGGMPYNVYTKLYDSLVQPIISYGAAIWGTTEYACIKSVQYKASRFYLGVGKYTPNTAVQGEMAWPFPQQRVGICITRAWCRFMNMAEHRLNKFIFDWSNSRNLKNWNHRVRNLYRNLEMDHLCQKEHTVNSAAVLDYMNSVLGEYHEQKWWQDMNRQNALRGQGRNKLRTYQKFKKKYEVESYLTKTMQFKYRCSFAKFRCGVAPLRIETGRYENLQEEERICSVCTMGEVESEFHAIMRCPLYTEYRDELFNEASIYNDSFLQLNDNDKFIYLFSTPEICFYTAKTCYFILTSRRRYLYNI